jgi:hypothetical protein
MRKVILGLSLWLGAACTPGSPEYGSCATTPDCQVLLLCTAPTGLLVNDGGNTYADAGICRYTCQTSVDCQTYNEVCGANGYCSKDGGY